jgi:pimeloyl-ACP methyl ester carboxylesterase
MSEKNPRSRNPLRKASPQVLALRLAFRTLGTVAPARAASIAERLFTSPPQHPIQEKEKEFLATGAPFTVPHGVLTLAAWTWGSGPPVLLMHGWGSRAGRFRYFVPALVAAGFRAVALDGPGHGLTGGRHATLPEFAAALTRVAASVGPVRGYVGHSLGAASVLFAMMRSVPAAPAVLLAPPADPEFFWKRFVRHLRIPPAVGSMVQDNLQRRLGFNWADVDGRAIAKKLDVPLLVVHDADDEDVTPADGAAVAAAARQGEFMGTSGLGHRGIMRDAEVVDRSVAFLARHVTR